MADTFTPAQIAEATAGAVKATDLRNWVRDGLFNTPMEEPRAGKPRAFPLLAVYEAVLLSELSFYGVPLDRAKTWNARIVEKIAQCGLATVAPDGSQYGPPGGLFAGVPQTVIFRRGDEWPLILTDSEGGETINRGFYVGRKNPGPAASQAQIHLPALLSPVRRVLEELAARQAEMDAAFGVADKARRRFGTDTLSEADE